MNHQADKDLQETVKEIGEEVKVRETTSHRHKCLLQCNAIARCFVVRHAHTIRRIRFGRIFLVPILQSSSVGLECEVDKNLDSMIKPLCWCLPAKDALRSANGREDMDNNNSQPQQNQQNPSLPPQEATILL